MLAPIELPETDEYMLRDYSKTGSGICFITKRTDPIEYQQPIDRNMQWHGQDVAEVYGDFWYSGKKNPTFKVKEDGRHVLIKIEWKYTQKGTTLELKDATQPATFRIRRVSLDRQSGVTYLVFPRDWKFAKRPEIG